MEQWSIFIWEYFCRISDSAEWYIHDNNHILSLAHSMEYRILWIERYWIFVYSTITCLLEIWSPDIVNTFFFCSKWKIKIEIHSEFNWYSRKTSAWHTKIENQKKNCNKLKFISTSFIPSHSTARFESGFE